MKTILIMGATGLAAMVAWPIVIHIAVSNPHYEECSQLATVLNKSGTWGEQAIMIFNCERTGGR
jgi:hypothetical protein